MSNNIPSRSRLYKECLALLNEAADNGDPLAIRSLRDLRRAEAQAKAARTKRIPIRRDTPPGRWELWIPKWHPGSANKREGKHWTNRRDLKRYDYEVVEAAKLLAGIDLDDRLRRVDAVMRYPNKRHWHDKDNLRKALYDALAAAHLIYDDRAEWCDQGRIDQEIGDKGTLVILEDLE